MRNLILFLVIWTTANANAEERSYRVFSTAGEFALAWGCENRLVDFERMDFDDAYEASVLESCKMQNHLINLYENRVLRSVEDDYWSVRSHGLSYREKSLESIGWAAEPSATYDVQVYAALNAWKWRYQDDLFVWLTPFSGAENSKLIYCESCGNEAFEKMQKALQWDKTKLEPYVLSFDFQKPESGSRVLFTVYGIVPKSDEHQDIEATAEFNISVDAASSAIQLEFVKIISRKDPAN